MPSVVEEGRRKKMKGASQHATSTAGANRRDVTPPPPGKNVTKPNMLVRPVFRFARVTSKGEVVELRHVEQVTWSDASAILNGQLTMRKAKLQAVDPTTVPQLGDRVLCQVDEGNGFRELWLMRVQKPAWQLSSDQVGLELRSDLDLLNRSEDHLRFRKDKAHPHGWYGHEIIIALCKQFKIPLGAVYKGTKRMNKKELKRGSPMRMIEDVLKTERRRSGRLIVMRWEGGRLYVIPLRRSATLLELGPTLIDAALSEELPDEYASSITMRGLVQYAKTHGSGKKTKTEKMWVRRDSKVAQSRFGFVHKIAWSVEADTEAQLGQDAEQYLAAIAKPRRKLTFEHVGMARLRRGDAIKLAFGDADTRGKIVWVTRVDHTLTAQNYRMNVTLVFEDPFSPTRYAKILTKVTQTQDDAEARRKILEAAKIAKFATSKKADDYPESPYSQAYTDSARLPQNRGL